jgi:hypothetical protein
MRLSASLTNDADKRILAYMQYCLSNYVHDSCDVYLILLCFPQYMMLVWCGRVCSHKHGRLACKPGIVHS